MEKNVTQVKKIIRFVYMRLASYINDLLYRYDCIIVPNFGGFVTNRISANLNDEKTSFYPPRKQVSFNAYLQHNDGLLANYIAAVDKITFEEAVVKISKEVASWKEELKIKTLVITSIGSITLSKDQKLIFEPNHTSNFLKEAFGLAETATTDIQRSEELVLNVTRSEDKKQLIPVISIAKKAAVAAVFIGVSYIGWNGLQDTDSSIKSGTNLSSDQGKQIQSATFVISNPLPVIELPVTKEVAHSFHLIAGAFKSSENATRKLESLQKLGFNARIVGENSHGLIQVAFGSYADLTEARTVIKDIRQNYTADVWLLEK